MSLDLESSIKFVKELENEATLLCKLRHRNVLSFVGACLKAPTFAIVTEFISGGSLYDVLHSKTMKKSLSMEQKLSIMFQISLAMVYLHKKGVIHRDLKSRNVLLEPSANSQYIPKVCDFGLAKSTNTIQEANMSNTQAVGTPLYLAPEVLLGTNYGPRCDVFSFSILMWEVLMGKIPYFDIASDLPLQMKVATDPTFRPTLPPKEISKASPVHARYVELMIVAWSHDPEQRPSFDKISEEFDSMIKEGQ